MLREEISMFCSKLYSKQNMVENYLDEYDKDGKKTRILLIDVNCKGSSTGNIVYDLYQGIKANGRTVSVCYGRGPLIEEDNIYKFGLDWETKMHAGLARLTGYNGCFSPFSTRRLINYIDEYKPDIIHIHELHAYFVNIKPLIEYIKKKHIPVVWTFHCEYMYTGKCGHAYDCEKYKTECCKCKAVKEYPKSLLFDKTKQMYQSKKRLLNDLDFTIITPSKWLADRVRTSFLKNKRIDVIFNGIDTDIFRPNVNLNLKTKLGIPEKSKIALFVAPTLTDERKGGKWIIEIAKKMQDKDIYFVMIGQGKIVDNMPNNIIMPGAVYNQNLLAEFYSIADVFLLCSERETYSMTCAEALCCGTKVVGFKAGAPETVFRLPYANFVDYGDVESVIYEINRILQ